MLSVNIDQIVKKLEVGSIESINYFPKYFEIETVNACNARCIMCTVDEWNKEKADEFTMSMELFEKFADEVKGYRDWIETVCLNRDGEPTLDKYLVKRVKMLKDAGIKKVTFATNAQKLTPKLSKELLEAGLDDIMISIDSIEKETYETIRKNLSFDKVLANILSFIQIRDENNFRATIRIRAINLELNKNQLDDWLEFWKSKLKEFDRAYVMPEHSWGNQSFNEMQKKVDYYSNKMCISPFSTFIMHVNGTVPLCGCDYKARHTLGQFGVDSIQTIWNGAPYSKIRALHKNSNRNQIDLCQGCSIWDKEYAE